MPFFSLRLRRSFKAPLVSRIGVMVAAMVALSSLGWLGWSGMLTREETRSAGQRAIRVAELRGTIAYLDEWLTMSALLAVISGEPRWIERYEEVGPRLAAAITEAVALATPEVGAQLAQTTNEAHRDLTAMQEAALKLSRNGDRVAARALLLSPEFDYLKAVYATGLETFGRDLMSLSATRSTNLNNRARLEMAGLALSLVLLATVAMAYRGRTRLRKALADTEHVARTDALTDLPNRRQLHNLLSQTLSATAKSGDPIALMMLDLDRFKPVNDIFGHAVGDALLVAVAARLRDLLGSDGMVARMGGDEFAILARSCGGADDVETLARRVISDVSEPFALDGREIRIGTSVGIALTREHNATGAQLLVQADLALYRAKSEGGNTFRLYDSGMDAAVAARQQLELDLRGALARDEFVLHYQPVISLETEEVVGCEALLRWHHPVRGLVPPDAFIPLAEETRLIVEIGTWALRRACLDAASWPTRMRVAVNVSAVQFERAGLVPAVAAALMSSGLAPQRLELEITESVLVQDGEMLSAQFEALRTLGVRIALDDFGTGYSSLNYLRRFRFDRIKIDRSFVATITDSATVAIMRAIVSLGGSLGMSITAEGIETRDQLRIVRQEGCREAQGYLFGRPQRLQDLGGTFGEREMRTNAA